MKTIRFVSQVLVPATLVLFVGCASESAKAPTQTESQPPSAAPPPVDLKDIMEAAAAKPSLPFDGEGWQPMFDGRTLSGWRVTQFSHAGKVQCESGAIALNAGNPFTGINWTNDFPKMDYEVALDAMRVSGFDFFCGLTVPVGDTFCSLIVGGWGGGVVGISSLDGSDASENETGTMAEFEQARWYRIRLRVTGAKIEAWIDAKKIVDAITTDRKISLRPGDIELSKPFGIASWNTGAALREIKWRHVDGPADPVKRRAQE